MEVRRKTEHKRCCFYFLSGDQTHELRERVRGGSGKTKEGEREVCKREVMRKAKRLKGRRGTKRKQGFGLKVLPNQSLSVQQMAPRWCFL